VWALLVPEAMAYAGIAGLSPEVELVVASLALVGHAIFTGIFLIGPGLVRMGWIVSFMAS
jgi:MFS superfamily sulfate permease-like transporter